MIWVLAPQTQARYVLPNGSSSKLEGKRFLRVELNEFIWAKLFLARRG